MLVFVGTLLVIRGSAVSATPARGPEAQASAPARYRIDSSKSRFVVETVTSAVSLMFAHDHRMEAAEFSGVSTFSRSTTGPKSLDLTVRADSLHLIEEKSIADRASIEKALRDDVLETAKYPDISFKSRVVVAERRGDGTYDVRLTGELLLHGVRRTITIPARVALQPDAMHAIGVFEIRQSDFKITPFSFVNGGVVIKDAVTISFDLTAHRLPEGSP